MKKLLSWLVLIIVVIWIGKNPAQAASLAHQVVTAVTRLASSL